MIDILQASIDFVTDPANYSGRFGLQHLLWQHIWYSVTATLAGLAIALPLGLWVGHRGRGELLVVQITNMGRAIPDFGLLLLAFTVVGLGFIPIFVALTALAVPPMLINAYVGVRQVDPDVRDAAYGSGMTGWQVLRQIELPMAVPLVMTGVRTATVQVVATATLAGAIGQGGFGRLIFDGIALRSFERFLVASAAVALLALAAEYGMGALERRLRPPGLTTAAQSEAETTRSAA